MKSRVICVSAGMLLTLFPNHLSACGPDFPEPVEEYLSYRVCDKDIPASENVYYISQTPESDDPETKAYLNLARRCEATRAEINSPWYYPSKECPVVAKLESVLDEALAYSGERYRDRYALQAARAMMTLQHYGQMMEWWRNVDRTIEEDAVRTNIRGYLARAFLEQGDSDEALDIYYELGDLESVKFCLKKTGEDIDDLDIIGYAAKHCPDNSRILPILQRRLRDPGVLNAIKEDVGLYERYLDICHDALASPGCSKPSVWLYTDAFLKELAGEHDVARDAALRAENAEGPDIVRESAKVLEMIIDARTSRIDREYEAKLLADLEWLDGKIRSDIGRVTDAPAAFDYMKLNLSYYYWNDMLRKIVLGCLAPRLIDSGKSSLALTLSNYADNRFLQLVHQRKPGQPLNNFDYSCSYFVMLDTLDVGSVVSHSYILFHPATELETFLSERAYRNYDYLNELIGTKYIRAMQYSQAIPYLTRVSEMYAANMNISPYFIRKPFATGFDEPRLAQEPIPQYKLSFAREMADYMRDIDAAEDPDKAAEAKILAGLGIKSSFDDDYLGCWALTKYVLSEYDGRYASFDSGEMVSYADVLIEEGLKEIRSPALAAKYHYKLGCYKTVAIEYGDTSVGREVLAKCDELRNWLQTR